MRLKNLLILFLLFGLSIYAQDTINKTLKDTLSNSEKNDQRVIEFGQLMEAFIHESDTDAFISKLNKNKFFERVLMDYPELNPEDPYIKGFFKGIDMALKSFPGEIIADVENGAYYDFIKYRYDERAQTYYALFRLYASDTGMNYHDYRVIDINGELQFSDMYVYLTGEHFTSSMVRVMQYTLPEDSAVENKNSLVNKESKKLIKAILYNKNGEYKKAFKIMDGFKSELSKEKFLLIFKTLIASQLDEEKYLKSLKDLISTFPNDQTIALYKIDYHIYKEEYIEAIQTINQLQNETEDDFLNFMKAGVAFEDENYDFALNLYDYTVTNYPDFFDGQAGYIGTLVLMGNFKDTTNYLDTLVADGYDKLGLIEYIEEEDENGYNILEDYAKSKNFLDWKKIE